MSTAWYFHTFEAALFKKICGGATPNQTKQLVDALTDPEEFGELEEEDLEHRTALATSILKSGISCAGRSQAEADELDEIVRMLFQRMGLAQAIKAKPVSPDAISSRLSLEVTNLAKQKFPQSVLTCFDNGRRFGESKCSACGYLVLSQEEIQKLRDDVAILIGDGTIAWKLTDAPKVLTSDLLQPLDAALSDSKLWLYGVFT